MNEHDAIRAIVFSASSLSEKEKLIAITRILLTDESSIDRVFDEMFPEKREISDSPSSPTAIGTSEEQPHMVFTERREFGLLPGEPDEIVVSYSPDNQQTDSPTPKTSPKQNPPASDYEPPPPEEPTLDMMQAYEVAKTPDSPVKPSNQLFTGDEPLGSLDLPGNPSVKGDEHVADKLDMPRSTFRDPLAKPIEDSRESNFRDGNR
jgi:hypothetical protein